MPSPTTDNGGDATAIYDYFSLLYQKAPEVMDGGHWMDFGRRLTNLMNEVTRLRHVLSQVQEVIPERIAANLDQARLVDRDRYKAALEAIVRGDYAEGAELCHPAVGLARETLKPQS